MSARMRHIWCVHPRSIRFSRCTPSRLIRFHRAARQGDILPDRRGPGGGNLCAHISYIYRNAAFHAKKGASFSRPLLFQPIRSVYKPYASSLRPDSSIASSAASASAASAPLAKMYSLILGSVPDGRTIPLLPPSRSNSMTFALGRPFTQVL